MNDEINEIIDFSVIFGYEPGDEWEEPQIFENFPKRECFACPYNHDCRLQWELCPL